MKNKMLFASIVCCVTIDCSAMYHDLNNVSDAAKKYINDCRAVVNEINDAVYIGKTFAPQQIDNYFNLAKAKMESVKTFKASNKKELICIEAAMSLLKGKISRFCKDNKEYAVLQNIFEKAVDVLDANYKQQQSEKSQKQNCDKIVEPITPPSKHE